jgi:predicted transcriptional regulator
MIIKLKLNSINHPILDELLKQYNLEILPLVPGVVHATHYVKIQTLEKDLQSEYQLRVDLRVCEDIIEIVEDFENSEPV